MRPHARVIYIIHVTENSPSDIDTPGTSLNECTLICLNLYDMKCLRLTDSPSSTLSLPPHRSLREEMKKVIHESCIKRQRDPYRQ